MIISEIINCVVLSLKDVFPEYEVYVEKTEQNFTGPCFYVTCLSFQEKRLIKNRYLRELKFDVQFFPGNAANIEMYNMADRLGDVLEYIEGKDCCINGNEIKGEVIDNVLHFYVSYDLFFYKTEAEDETMTDLRVLKNVKG